MSFSQTASQIRKVVLLLAFLASTLPLEAKIPVPEFYGLYIVIHGEPHQMVDAIKDGRARSLSTATALGGIGLAERYGVISLGDIHAEPQSYFLFYGPDFKRIATRVVLFKLTYGETIPVGDVSGIGKASRTIQAPFWTAADKVTLRVGPVPGHPDLLRVVPSRSLQDGAYALSTEIFGENVMKGGAAELGMIADFYVGAKKPAPSVLPGIRKGGGPSPQSDERLSFHKYVQRFADPRQFPIHSKRISASFEASWKAINRAIRNSERWLHIPLTVQESDSKTGILVTEPAEKPGWNISNKRQVVVGLKPGLNGTSDVQVLVAAYNANLFPQKGPWKPYSQSETAEMANDFFNEVERQLKLAPFSECQVSAEAADLTGKWTGSLVALKDLKEHACTIAFKPATLSQGLHQHTSGTLTLGGLPCTVQLSEKERSGSMVTFSTFSAAKKCRRFAKKHELDIFPTTDGRILVRLRKVGRDTITAKALLQRAQAQRLPDAVGRTDTKPAEPMGKRSAE